MLSKVFVFVSGMTAGTIVGVMLTTFAMTMDPKLRDAIVSICSDE